MCKRACVRVNFIRLGAGELRSSGAQGACELHSLGQGGISHRPVISSVRVGFLPY
jgi:hypothetical protein